VQSKSRSIIHTFVWRVQLLFVFNDASVQLWRTAPRTIRRHWLALVSRTCCFICRASTKPWFPAKSSDGCEHCNITTHLTRNSEISLPVFLLITIMVRLLLASVLLSDQFCYIRSWIHGVCYTWQEERFIGYERSACHTFVSVNGTFQRLASKRHTMHLFYLINTQAMQDLSLNIKIMPQSICQTSVFFGSVWYLY